MERCKCPYCMEDIGMDELKFYIRMEKKAVSPILKAFLTPEKRRQQNDPFYRFWVGYGKKMNPDEISHRIIKTYEDLQMAQADFAARAELLKQKPAMGSDTDMERPGELLPGQGAARSLEHLEDESVICEIEKKQNMNEPPKFIIREDGQRVAMTKIACPRCYNVLPEEIFDLPVIKIALAANKFGGKTCLALSWFRSLNDPNGGGLNSHIEQMDFVSMLEAGRGMDDEFSDMLKEFVKDDICPRGTNKQFVPPIFLKLTYRAREKHEAIVGIYDAAGEIITDSLKDDELVSYMSFMDGIIYMIEPSKTGIRADLAGRHLSINNESSQFYKTAELLSPEEQIRVQREDFKKETLADLMQKAGGEANLRENCSNEVLQALRRFVDDEVLKQQYVALAISKCDELRGNPQIVPYNEGDILFMDERKMDDGQRDFRREQIEKLFSEEIFNVRAFENVFKEPSYHMIAALGCGTKVFGKVEKDEAGNEIAGKSKLKDKFLPIRAEEPLLSLISKYAEEHGWNN